MEVIDVIMKETTTTKMKASSFIQLKQYFINKHN